MERLVVVGASLAGLRAVEAARREGFTGSITLIGAEDHLPYDRPPLSKAVLHGEASVEPFVDEAGFADLDVDLRLGTPATGLDTGRRVVVSTGSTSGESEEIGYDGLVIATGARPRPWPEEWFRDASSLGSSTQGFRALRDGRSATSSGTNASSLGSSTQGFRALRDGRSATSSGTNASSLGSSTQGFRALRDGRSATSSGTNASSLGSSTQGFRALRNGRSATSSGTNASSLGSSTSGTAGVHSLRTADDAEAIRAALDAGARTVVIGAGFIGSEVASSARKRGLPVTVVEALELPLTRSIGPEAGQVCADLHVANGTELRLGVGVDRIQSTAGHVTGVLLADGTLLPADLVVVGTGVLPNTDWLEGSGLTLHERDRGIVCDARLWTGVDGVYAAGDVAHSPNPLFDDQLMRLEHWTNAAEQGAAAARHALSPDTAEPLAPVPYFWSDWYAHRIQFVGTPVADEVLVVAAEPFIALYRREHRVVGALTVDGQRLVMKLRRRIADRGSWMEAVQFAEAGLAVGVK